MRELEPGDASHILKGVVEQWAPARQVDPVVLTISEPGRTKKVYLADETVLTSLGVAIDQRSLPPDAVIVGIGVNPASVWIVEAVANDGPVTEERHAALAQWARDQRISGDDPHFVYAFLSRNGPAARKRLKDLAVGTLAWLLDEPALELSWHEIVEAS